MINHAVLLLNGWKSQVRAVHIVSMVIWIVIVDWSSTALRLIIVHLAVRVVIRLLPWVLGIALLGLRVCMLLSHRSMNRARWSHLSSNILRGWVNLNTDLGNHWCNKFRWLLLSGFLSKLLCLDELDVVLSGWTFSIALRVPRSIGDFLHL